MASCFLLLSSFRLTLVSITSIFILSYASSTSTSETLKNNPRLFNKIYAFGDSYTDTGNTNSSRAPSFFTYISNPPYGRTFFHRPTNRYSDGRIMIDFVAQALSLPYLPPHRNLLKADKTNGINYAVGGCTAINYSFFLRNNLSGLDITTESLQTQLGWFDKFLEGEGCRNLTSTRRQCEAAFSDSLVWLGEIGANDYSYIMGSSLSPLTIQHLAIKSITNFLEAMLNKGAQYVVVQGLPMSGCLALFLTISSDQDRDDMGCVRSINEQRNSHNIALQSELNKLRKRHPHAVIVYADYWKAHRTIVENAITYGFREPFKACCGSSGSGPYNFDILNICGSPGSSSCADPSEYINWDGGHLTEAMNKAIAELFLNGTTSLPPFEYLLSRKRKSG